MIKTKRVYENAEDADGFRVLVDRPWPRGLRKEQASIDEWMKEAAPSDDLRRWFGHDPNKWAEFKKKFRQELDTKDEILNMFIKKARKGNMTLLYAAKDTEHNNAIVLKEFLEEKLHERTTTFEF